MALPALLATLNAETFFAVISTSGTSCVQLPLFPGSNPAALNFSIKYATVFTSPAEPGARPGQVVCVGPAGIDVRCGDEGVRLTQLQRAGGKRLGAADFQRGFPIETGMAFE